VKKRGADKAEKKALLTEKRDLERNVASLIRGFTFPPFGKGDLEKEVAGQGNRDTPISTGGNNTEYERERRVRRSPCRQNARCAWKGKVDCKG